ncbi:MAG: hypothetical protein ACR2P3_06110 [Geminicoccaceae bacterium]
MNVDLSPAPGDSLLLTDLYQLNMLQAYRDADIERTAIFEFFVRRLPPRLRALEAERPYPVHIASELKELAAKLDRECG